MSAVRSSPPDDAEPDLDELDPSGERAIGLHDAAGLGTARGAARPGANGASGAVTGDACGATEAAVLKTVNRWPGPASNLREQRAKEAEQDRELLTRAQGGDSQAFRELIERHQRRAFAIALSLVRDENDARELVQDAFLRVHRNLASFQGSSSFFTWLYRIVTNLAIDLMRKPSRRVVDLDDTTRDLEDTLDTDMPLLSRIDGADPVEQVKRKEIAGRLQAALEDLPEYHRAVIVMREVDGLSYDEMAASLGVSKGTIMSRLFHARQKLQKALADCYVEHVGVVPKGKLAAGDEAQNRGNGSER
jgi:RNA polymerase sigma-70 factor (ECF subfamily)